MDERQSQVKEGAGLEESRINTDFADFLKKYGPHAIMVVAAVVLLYRGYEFLEQRRVSRVNDAFLQLEAAGPAAEANPNALLALAEEFQGVRGVGMLARLRAADAYLVAVRRGVHPGAVIGPEGAVENEDELLDEESRQLYLDKAEREYRTVLEKVSAKPAMALHAVNALYGLASVAESRGDLDEARGFYERIVSLAEEQTLPPHAEIAGQRIESLDEVGAPPRLYDAEELPRLAWEEEAAADLAPAPSGGPGDGGLDPISGPVLPDVPDVPGDEQAGDGDGAGGAGGAGAGENAAGDPDDGG